MKKAARISISLMFLVCMALLATNVEASYTANVHLSGFQALDGHTGEVYFSSSLTPYTYSYCVDRNTTVSVPGDYYGVLKTLTTDGLKEAAWIMDNYAASKIDHYTDYTKTETGVAVQWAIWIAIGQSVITESGYNDKIKALTNLILDKAGSYSSEWNAAASHYRYLDLYKIDSHNNLISVQDFLVPVPIPGAVWLLGSGLLGLIGVRKKLTA